MRGPNNDLLEALSIMVIARVPECLAFHVVHGERGYQGEQQQRAGGGWRADERVGRRASERVCLVQACDVAVCDVTGSLVLLFARPFASIRYVAGRVALR